MRYSSGPPRLVPRSSAGSKTRTTARAGLSFTVRDPERNLWSFGTYRAPTGPQGFYDGVAQVIARSVGVPHRATEQVLHASRASVSAVLGDRPAVLARQISRQPQHEPPNPPPQLHPTKPPSHPTQQLIQRPRPSLGRHMAIGRGGRRPRLDEPVDGRDVAFESDRRGSHQSHRWDRKHGTTEMSSVKHFLARSHAR